MTSDGDSFLPRIESVFYSVFDINHGPKIISQVPEGLIAVPPPALSSYPSVPPTPSAEIIQFPYALPQVSGIGSRNSSVSIVSPTDHRPNPRNLPSPNNLNKRSLSSNRQLFNFEDISQYVIPRSPLCGRLVRISTKRHTIMGFPVELQGKYKRNYFRYNLCFVFERGADLSCYEPIVRKVSRVLTACEEESGFLSSPTTLNAIHAILEQLYEDLNSYSETSIPIDQFNSIELKIFPFYPNPPPVNDWMVPVALINLEKRFEDNWDLTMAKVCPLIDGTNHVSRIAHLAECDLHLTRLAIAHLLYYQVIMTIDIFQYSNMYTLRKSIQWLADEAHVKEECGPYVVKPGGSVTDWPKLLHLYARLKPGITVLEWMNEHDVHELDIDVRRFTSFGVIKGFLRRIHRWPVLLRREDEPLVDPPINRKRMKSFSNYPITPLNINDYHGPQNLLRGRTPQVNPVTPSVSPDLAVSAPTSPKQPQMVIPAPLFRPRRQSAAEKKLEQVRNRDAASKFSPRTSWMQYPAEGGAAPGITTTSSSPRDGFGGSSGIESRRQSMVSMPGSPNGTKPRLSKSPSAPANSSTQPTIQYPVELPSLLDGEHHTDELAVKFEAGWPLLSKWLQAAGGGQGDGDFGRVAIIYR